MFKFTAEFKTLEEMQEFIDTVQGRLTGVPAPAPNVPEEAPEPVKKAAPRKVKAKEPEAEIDAPRPPKAKEAPAVEVPAGELTYESHVRPAGLELVKAVGRQALLDCFDKFGVANGAELTQDQYQPFLDEIKSAMAKGKK